MGTEANKTVKARNIVSIKEHGLFNTPENFEELEAWIELHAPEDKMHLWTAMYMYNNLLCSYDNVRIIGEDDEQQQ